LWKGAIVESTDETPGSSPDRSGAERRFAEFSGQCRERVHRYVQLRIGAALRRRVDSEDVLQEVLLEASRLFQEGQAGDFPDGDSFFSWLARIVDNKIRTLARHHVAAERRTIHREVRLESNEASQPVRSGESPSAELQKQEGWASLRTAIELLPPREKEVIELVHLQKLRVTEAAERMGKTPNATSVLLHHALKRLRGILKRREG